MSSVLGGWQKRPEVVKGNIKSLWITITEALHEGGKIKANGLLGFLQKCKCGSAGGFFVVALNEGSEKHLQS